MTAILKPPPPPLLPDYLLDEVTQPRKSQFNETKQIGVESARAVRNGRGCGNDIIMCAHAGKKEE